MAISIQYPIAKDREGQWVNISEAIRSSEYFCPECDSPFVARLGTVKKHHFAHRPGYSGECTGESGYHHLAKHLLAYQFEREDTFPLIYKCPMCKRTIEKKKRIISIQVEKGDQAHRPDVRLLLDGNEIINCEVVYKNPLGDKLKMYQEQKANLLIWEIVGVTDGVPPLIQYDWEEAEKNGFLDYRAKPSKYLILFASPMIDNHPCHPFGTAYVFNADCWKCGQKTKAALISSWYPMWGAVSKQESGYISHEGRQMTFYTNISLSSIPKGFWEELNRQYGTHLNDDYSNTISESYIMNHCGKCGAKIGDFYLPTMFGDSLQANGVNKVTVEYRLTPWEI